MAEHDIAAPLVTRFHCIKGRKANARSMDLDTRLPHKFTSREHGKVQVYSELYTTAESMEFAREHGHPMSELAELHSTLEHMDSRHYTQEMLDALS